ncbi:hydroxyacid dehydrogenase [Aliiroseovarius sp.]|uniref:hydroxyacid dehydrogenase n=1 Tax=Aliiroseovarius sp. TaxID=1872442 RepID=UPI002617CA5A|nr:hydroxyacid dehydrogenase [Aliiroseovarius sp.]
MILITEFMEEEAVERLKAARPTAYAPDLADRQEDIPARMAGIQALIVRNRTQVTEALLASAPDLKMVGGLGAGLDNIDLDACAAAGVEVIPATEATTLPVAEYVVANALILLRQAYQSGHAMKAGNWPQAACSGREVSGRRLGLIGFGAIAQEAARLATALGMKVSAYDPHVPVDDPAWEGATARHFEAILASSDVISLHVPLNGATRHMMNAEAFAMMREGAVVINAARGGVVDEAALADAMRAGHIGGAALDVFEEEPLTEEGAGVFKGLSNLILTPHIAGITRDSHTRASTMIADLVLERLS